MPRFQISPYLQERYVWAGQSDVYGKCNELIDKFLRIKINSMQVHRVTNMYGELSVGIVNESSTWGIEKVEPKDIVYAELDGGMVLTREDKWQEVKVGRIFRHSDIHALSATRQEILNSTYTAQLGDYKLFTKHFEPLVDKFESLKSDLVFVTDGATWIKNWIKDNYPQATAILDYYHASEYIGKWCDWTFPNKDIRKDKLTNYRTLLLEKGGQELIYKLQQDVQNMEKRTQTIEIEQVKILDYFKGNAYRMEYPLYQKRGLCIGSGAIEASHRTIVQKRMKLSGQRWAQSNAQNMLNLRSANMSGLWDDILFIIRNQYKAAA